MGIRPHVVLSCAMSVDGYIDDTSPERLVLSNADDLDRVDQVRAECDAILIGANTLRRDNPGLLVKSAARRDTRTAEGLPAYPVKVVVTSGGDLSADRQCWRTGGDKLVYCPDATAAKVGQTLAGLAEVVGVGPAVDFGAVLDDLGTRGIRRLLVEGGGRIHTQFLTGDLADELHLVIAPFFVGDETAPRFVHPGAFPDGPGRPMTLAEARPIGDVVLLRYLPARAKTRPAAEAPAGPVVASATRSSATGRGKGVKPGGSPGGNPGYSGTPPAKKLGVKAGHVVVLIGRPEGWRLPDPPADVNVRDGGDASGEPVDAPADAGVDRAEDAAADGAEDAAGTAGVDAGDVVVAFCRSRAELERRLPALTGGLRPASALWIAWPRRAGGHTSDITENLLREILLPSGLVDVKVAAIDQDWSGLKFVWRKENRPRTSAGKGA